MCIFKNNRYFLHKKIRATLVSQQNIARFYFLYLENTFYLISIIHVLKDDRSYGLLFL